LYSECENYELRKTQPQSYDFYSRYRKLTPTNFASRFTFPASRFPTARSEVSRTAQQRRLNCVAKSAELPTNVGQCVDKTQNIIDIFRNSIEILTNSIEISTNFSDILTLICPPTDYVVRMG